MAIRRYTKAADNAPAWGYAIVHDIQGTGEFKLEIQWTRPPQDGLVTFAEMFNLPPEFVPTSEATLLTLDQSSPSSKTYNIIETINGGAGTTIGATSYTSVVDPSTMRLVTPAAWHLNTSSTGKADEIVMYVGEFTSEEELFAIVHDEGEIRGNITYFGGGDDVSASYGLVPGTRWSLPTSLISQDDIAEMVFVDGEQIVGDIYDYYHQYGGGSYDMFRMDDGTVHILLVDPVVPPMTLFFAVFIRVPEPRINIRYEDPFDSDGIWIEYFNIPKGNIVISYYIN